MIVPAPVGSLLYIVHGLLTLVQHITCVVIVLVLSTIVCLTKLDVKCAHGSHMLADGSGDVRVLDFTGKRVFCLCNVPQVSNSIVSVRCLLLSECKVNHEKDCVYISRPGQFSVSGAWERDAYRIPNSAVCANVQVTGDGLKLWHRRFGHLGFGNLRPLSSENRVTGFPEGIKNYEWRPVHKALCKTCLIAKQTQLPYRTSASICTRPLQLVHMDVCGPMPKVAMNGERYFVTMLDDHSKFATVRVCKSKADVVASVTSTLTVLQTQSGCAVQRIRTDRGFEVFSLSSFCLAQGTIHETTAGYTPRSNGAAERLNRTLLDRVRAMLSGLPDNKCGNGRSIHPQSCTHCWSLQYSV
jgi:hypothetical protein